MEKLGTLFKSLTLSLFTFNLTTMQHVLFHQMPHCPFVQRRKLKSRRQAQSGSIDVFSTWPQKVH